MEKNEYVRSPLGMVDDNDRFMRCGRTEGVKERRLQGVKTWLPLSIFSFKTKGTPGGAEFQSQPMTDRLSPGLLRSSHRWFVPRELVGDTAHLNDHADAHGSVPNRHQCGYGPRGFGK